LSTANREHPTALSLAQALGIVSPRIGAGMPDLFKWIFEPSHSPAVGAWGLIVGSIGLLVSIVGFAATVQQLMRTADATKAAAEAVDRIKSRVAAYDAVFEISRSTSALHDINGHLKRKTWAEAITSYSNLRDALVRLIELPSALDQERKEKLSLILEETRLFSDSIESSVARSKEPQNITRAITAHRSHAEILARIRIFVEGAQ